MGSADVDKVVKQLGSLFDVTKQDCVMVSAKLGIGIESIFTALVNKIGRFFIIVYLVVQREIEARLYAAMS